MSKNNPFRNKPSSNVHHNAADCGKSKFVPNTFKGVNTNSNIRSAFRKNDNRKSMFHRNKEKLRFNEVAKGAKPENSTPWNKYKDEIIFKQREEHQVAQQAKMESGQAKTILKQREINYRQNLVEQKKKEVIKWEDFAEDCEQTEKAPQTQGVGFSNKYKGNQSKEYNFKPEKNRDAQYKTKFHKNKSKFRHDKDFISKDLLKNFDSRKLNYEQNDKLRRIITSTTIASSETSLQNVVNELKKKKIKAETQNKKFLKN